LEIKTLEDQGKDNLVKNVIKPDEPKGYTQINFMMTIMNFTYDEKQEC
jgi:hypothetical protein